VECHVIEARSFWSLLAARAAESPDGTLAVDERGERLTFGSLRERSERVAAGLHALGVHSGSVVAWQLPTWLESMVLVGALARLDAVQVPMLPIYREREVGFILRQTRPELFIVPTLWRGFDYADLAGRLTDPAAPDRIDCEVLTCDRLFPEADAETLPPEPEPPARDLVRWVFYTSGTTADPKGARHSDATLAAGSAGVTRAFRVSASDRYPMVFPFTHVGGIGMLFIQLMSGAGAIVLEQFDAERDMVVLARHGMTLGAGGTPLALMYLAAQRKQPNRPLFPQLRGVITGAAPKAVTLHDELRQELGGSGALSCYGLTEVPFLAVNDVTDTDAQRATTEGRAIAGAEVRVVGDDGAECAPGELGELRARGPQVCLGYVDSLLDADAFDEQGYFRTGDLGTVDRDGYVSVVGRLKDVIIRKGEKISALEIESVLASHPAIGEVAVIGLPDPDTGERACAVVVPADPTTPVGLADVAAICRAAGLARQKTPERVEMVPDLPRNASGKVLKYQLRARFDDDASRSD
jgi:acyl-CoA synthetase (AMP-forming)/AMP-acid ligase II